MVQNSLEYMDELFARIHELLQEGRSHEAVPLAEEFRNLTRQYFGEQAVDFAVSLDLLANQYLDVGRLADAKPLYDEALKIFCEALGPFHPYCASTMNNLATLYQTAGDFEKAERFFRGAIEIRDAADVMNYDDYATNLNNLALLYQNMGKYEAAEPLFLRALEMHQIVFGEDHPSYAVDLGNLALLYLATGRYEVAKEHFRQASEIDLRALGKNHPSYAVDLGNLGLCYEQIGDYTAAEALYAQSLEINRVSFGEDHPSYAFSLKKLAFLYTAVDRLADALNLMERAESINNKVMGQVFSIGSDRQRMAYLKAVEADFAMFLSLVSQYLPNSAPAVNAALELVLRRKAVAARALATQRDAVYGGKYPDLKPMFRELTILRMQIAQKILAGPKPSRLPEYQESLRELNIQKEFLEAELAQRIPEMNLYRKLRDVDRQAVAMALPEGTALVEIIKFNVVDFKAVPARGESRWKPARYVAFVLPSRKPNNVQMIDLGEAERIDQMIAAFRSAITEEAENRCGLGLGKIISDRCTGSGITLRADLFDPLLAAIGDHKRLMIAPDGDLTRLPFEVLPTDDGQLLIDKYQISYLSTGRDVLHFGAAYSGQPTEPLVIADPDFDLSIGDDLSQSRTVEPLGRQLRAFDLSRICFEPLPGTREEGVNIAELLKVQPWLGKKALEKRLKSCRSPCILHLATHGFFEEDQDYDLNNVVSQLGAEGWRSGGSRVPMSVSGLENPLIRSGLALAGANWKSKKFLPPPEAEDGILSAEDVSGLDLLATELVVLSACETGLGEVHMGEGVFGLRRTFVLAGAKTLVMSLWKVPDQQTRELMEDFYRRILTGQPRGDALREAQLEMKKIYQHPYFWGAFICQGDPGPLTTRSPEALEKF